MESCIGQSVLHGRYMNDMLCAARISDGITYLTEKFSVTHRTFRFSQQRGGEQQNSVCPTASKSLLSATPFAEHA